MINNKRYSNVLIVFILILPYLGLLLINGPLLNLTIFSTLFSIHFVFILIFIPAIYITIGRPHKSLLFASSAMFVFSIILYLQIVFTDVQYSEVDVNFEYTENYVVIVTEHKEYLVEKEDILENKVYAGHKQLFIGKIDVTGYFYKTRNGFKPLINSRSSY